MRLATSFQEFYGQEKNINSVLFPKQIAGCLSELGMEIGDYLHNHSVLPFYRLFLKEDLYREIIWQMLYGEKAYTNRLVTQQNRNGHVIRSDRLYYCPICLKEHMKYETIERFHQVSGVYVCPKHFCYLNNVPIQKYKKLISMKEWDMSIKMCDQESVLVQVARDVEYILNSLPELDNVALRSWLLDEAIQRRVYYFQKWNENRNDDWKVYYEKFPNEYAIFKKKASFRRFAAHELTDGINPIEYLVFIQSLYGSFENFMALIK